MQTYDKARNAVALALSPVVKALVDPDGALRDVRNLDSVRIKAIVIVYFGLHSYCVPVKIVWECSAVHFLHVHNSILSGYFFSHGCCNFLKSILLITDKLL